VVVEVVAALAVAVAVVVGAAVAVVAGVVVARVAGVVVVVGVVVARVVGVVGVVVVATVWPAARPGVEVRPDRAAVRSSGTRAQVAAKGAIDLACMLRMPNR
jgi:hypothetical protein